MFKPQKKAILAPQQLLLILVIAGAIFLFVRWRSSRDRNNIKKEIMASAPKRICSSCLTENDAETQFCKHCGKQDFK